MDNININPNAHPVSQKKRPDMTTAAQSMGWPRMESRLVHDPVLRPRPADHRNVSGEEAL
jgi:hypothetical protein